MFQTKTSPRITTNFRRGEPMCSPDSCFIHFYFVFFASFAGIRFCFGHLDFDHLDLFRISCFVLRIYYFPVILDSTQHYYLNKENINEKNIGYRV